MIERLQKKFALSHQGAVDFIKGCIACAFQNFAFMIPTSLLYLLVADLMNGGVPSNKIAFYIIGCVLCVGLIMLATWFQYNATYFATYIESGKRRISLAEKLRKLPLSFFGQRDLAGLTSTIMSDCATLEQNFSHYFPGLYGSMISTVLISISLFVFDWRMALAVLWVVPVAFAIVIFSSGVQKRMHQKSMVVKITCADGIQEYIETVRDMKANNAEEVYLNGLDGKIKAVEKWAITTEFGLALWVVSAQLVLKLGIATVALVGSMLLVGGRAGCADLLYVSADRVQILRSPAGRFAKPCGGHFHTGQY